MNFKTIRNWTVYFLLVVTMTVVGNWLWQHLSTHDSGPLADVTWSVGPEANFVYLSIKNKDNEPLAIPLVTIVTNEGVFDVSTNHQGKGKILCQGTVVTAIRASQRLVYSKALAEITGTPSLAEGLNFEIVVKRPDILIPN